MGYMIFQGTPAYTTIEWVISSKTPIGYRLYHVFLYYIFSKLFWWAPHVKAAWIYSNCFLNWLSVAVVLYWYWLHQINAISLSQDKPLWITAVHKMFPTMPSYSQTKTKSMRTFLNINYRSGYLLHTRATEWNAINRYFIFHIVLVKMFTPSEHNRMDFVHLFI
jgi:hypothetical protein